MAIPAGGKVKTPRVKKDGSSTAQTWKSGYGGAPWLCALGLHPRPERGETCPACGREIKR